MSTPTKPLKSIPIMCDRCGRTLKDCTSASECLRFRLEEVGRDRAAPVAAPTLTGASGKVYCTRCLRLASECKGVEDCTRYAGLYS